MATVKEETVKKRGRPSKKQEVTEDNSNKKNDKKKVVKKNILTSEKKGKKESSKTNKPDVEKTKKTDEVNVTDANESAKKINDLIESVNATDTTPPPRQQTPQAQPSYNPNNQNSTGILPVEDDDNNNDNQQKQTMTTTQQNIQKVYTCKKGTVLMDGYLKIGIDDTNISRRNDVMFDIYGKSEHGAEFKTEFECIDKEEGDILVYQLNDYEKNPAKYIVAVEETKTETPSQQQTNPPVQQTPPPTVTQQKSHALDANGNIDMTKLSAAEIAAIHNKNMPVEEKKKPQDFAGIPLTAVNIDELINNLPPKVENQNINPVNQPINQTTSSSVADISNILNNQNLAQIEAYGKSIQDHIDTSFQANVWGGMPQNDVRLFLKNCDSQYLYDLINDGVGFFIKIKKDNTEIRVPKNTTEYLKVK